MHPKDLSIHNYTYELPPERIAAFPLTERDTSKLLIYKNGQLSDDIYKNISDYIPGKTLLVFNNTKVIQARILFQKPTGGVIEIFCLEPHEPVNEYSTIMNKKGSVRWKCMIGGAGKWKEGGLSKNLKVKDQNTELKAVLVDRLPDAYVVELSWQPADLGFAEVLEQSGVMPLPPYIKRKAEVSDKERYQTIYAKHEGSVAAPTAGLHVTECILESFRQKNIDSIYVTLHVGAGTFKPVKAASLAGHEMHAEWIDVRLDTIQRLINNLDNGIIAVGTTSLRTIESLYWMGVRTSCKLKVRSDKSPKSQMNAAELSIGQWDVYEEPLLSAAISAKEALTALGEWMTHNKLERLITQTQILIAPGYTFRVAGALVTNFHQPQSTLLLLVAAAVGNDWKKIYDHALQNGFRFLSYGDGSLLFIPDPYRKIEK